MPRECIAYIKYRDGHSVISHHKLEGDKIFGLEEMERWIKESGPEIMEVSVSKVPARLKKALHAALKSGKIGS